MLVCVAEGHIPLVARVKIPVLLAKVFALGVCLQWPQRRNKINSRYLLTNILLSKVCFGKAIRGPTDCLCLPVGARSCPLLCISPFDRRRLTL